MILKPFIPSYPLNEHIDKLWVFESSNGIPLQDMRLIVPNGLFKIIIPYRNGISSTINGKFTLAKESSIAMIGIADTHAIINSQTEEDFGSIGIEFKPFSAYRFFRIPMKELTNQVYGIDELLGKEGRQLQSDLSGAASPEERISLVEKFLTALLLRNNRSDLITDFALQQIISSNGLVSIEKLSAKTGYSRRYLEMKFSENVGVSPKTLASIKRFQRFYQAWGKFQENRFFEQEIYDYYFDHSHFIKEFKRFTGMAPTKFLKNENEFGRIFYKD